MDEFENKVNEFEHNAVEEDMELVEDESHPGDNTFPEVILSMTSNDEEGDCSGSKMSPLVMTDGNPVSGSDVALEDVPKKFPCIYSELCCEQQFPSRMARNQHSKACFGSLLKWCCDVKCAAEKVGRFDALSDLVNHCIDDHGCVRIAGIPGEFLLPITLDKSFFEEDKVFNAKCVACCDLEKEGSTFRVVFVALYLKNVSVGPSLFIVPMTCGESDDEAPLHLLKLAVGLLDSNGDSIRTSQIPTHKLEDGKHVLCSTFRTLDAVLDGIKNNNLPLGYLVKDLLEEYNTNWKNNFGIRFKVEAYRCESLWDNTGTPVRSYNLSWEEVELSDKFKTMLKKIDEKESLAMTGIIIPNIDHNMLIESISFELAMTVVLASVLDIDEDGYEFDTDGTALTLKETVRRPKALILFPTNGMMFSYGTELRKRLNVHQIISAMIPGVTPTYLQCIKEFGCDVLMTTLEVCHQLLKKEDVNLSATLFSGLKAVIFADADSIDRRHNTSFVSRTMNRLLKEVSSGLRMIGISRCVNSNALHWLRLAYFRSPLRALSLGSKSNSLLTSWDVDEINAETLEEKTNAIIDILQGNASTTRWVIIGDERCRDYDANFKALELKLNQVLEQRPIVRFDEKDSIAAMKGETTGLTLFTSTARSILLTSYDCVGQIKKCGGVILFRMPNSKAELLCVSPLAITEKGVKKPVFTMCDSHSLEDLNFAMFYY